MGTLWKSHLWIIARNLYWNYFVQVGRPYDYNHFYVFNMHWKEHQNFNEHKSLDQLPQLVKKLKNEEVGTIKKIKIWNWLWY